MLTLFSIAHKYGHLPFSIARKNISCSTIPFERDSSRFELTDPIGYTEPINIGKYQFKLPAITRSGSINFSGVCFDLLGNTDTVRSYFKKSPRFKRLFESMSDSFKMGLFYTRNVSRMSKRRDDSFLMSQRVLYHDLEDRTNREEFNDFVIWRSNGGHFKNELSKDEQQQLSENEPQQLSEDEQQQLRDLCGKFKRRVPPDFIPAREYKQKTKREYLKKVGPPRKILPENRRLHYYPKNHEHLFKQYIHYPQNLDQELFKEPIQILSETKGSYCEISVLDPLLTLCQVDEDVKEDATRFFSVKVLRTCKNEMTTNLIQFEINVNELAYDALERIIEKMSTRSATMKRIGPVLTKIVTVFGYFFEAKMYYQKGFQHSSSYNFNLELDKQRVAQNGKNFTNWPIYEGVGETNLIDPNLEEVNSRWFDHSDARLWINLDINKILDLFKSRH